MMDCCMAKGVANGSHKVTAFHSRVVVLRANRHITNRTVGISNKRRRLPDDYPRMMNMYSSRRSHAVAPNVLLSLLAGYDDTY